MLKFSEIFEFSRENNPKIPILKEFEWFEWFERFGPSPIEPFNSGEDVRHAVEVVEEDVHPVGNVPYEQIISGPADPEGGWVCRPSLPARFFQENLQTSVCKVL